METLSFVITSIALVIISTVGLLLLIITSHLINKGMSKVIEYKTVLKIYLLIFIVVSLVNTYIYITGYN